MSYVDSVLQPGERVIRRASLHWIMHLRGLLCLVAALVLYVAGASLGASGTALHIVVGLIALIGLALLAHTAWRQWGTEIAVTDRRVIYKTGLFSRDTAEMNMDKIESVTVRQSIIGRILGYGSVDVRGTGEGLEGLDGVADPLPLRNAITAR